MCCGKILPKLFFLIFNVMVMLLGIGTMTQGMVQLKDIDQFLKNFTGIPVIKTEEHWIPVTIVGFAIIVVGLLGIMAALKENSCMASVYITLIFISIFFVFGLAFYTGIPPIMNPYPVMRHTVLKIGLGFTSLELVGIILALLLIRSISASKVSYKFTATA